MQTRLEKLLICAGQAGVHYVSECKKRRDSDYYAPVDAAYENLEKATAAVTAQRKYEEEHGTMPGAERQP